MEATPCAVGVHSMVKARQGADVPGDLTSCVLKGHTGIRFDGVIVIDAEHENRHAVEIISKKSSQMIGAR